MQQSLRTAGVVIADEEHCRAADCPLCNKRSDLDVAAVRIPHGDKIYGVLVVTLPKGLSQDHEEQALLEEVAGDVGFALHGIALEHDRAVAEEALRKAHDELEIRVAERTADLTRAMRSWNRPAWPPSRPAAPRAPFWRT